MPTTPEISIRYALPEDVSLILELIKGLALYEQLESQVIATEESLLHSIFRDKQARVLIAEYREEPVGFALFFYNYSTFLGKAGIYLEDLFVRPEFRNLGIGKALFTELSRIAVQENCSRLDWCCLDWNESAKAFYRSLGASELETWRVFRLEDSGLIALAK